MKRLCRCLLGTMENRSKPVALIHLSRIFFIMKLTGIYLVDNRTLRKYRIPYIIYAIIAWCLSSVDVIRIVSLFDMNERFGTEVVDKVIALVAHSASLLVYTCCFFYRNHFIKLITSWERLLRYRARVTENYTDYSRHLRNVSIGLYMMICVVPLGLLAYFIFYISRSDPAPNRREILIPHWYKNTSVTAYRTLAITHVLLKSISTMSICAFVSLVVLTSSILRKEFNTLTAELAKAVKGNHWDYCIEGEQEEEQETEMATQSNHTPTTAPVVEESRLIHDKITHMVGIADSIFQVCIGLALFMAMSVTILIMYNSAKSFTGMSSMDPFAIYVIILILFAAAVQLIIIGSSVTVNFAAHSPLKVLYSIDLRQLPSAEMFPVQLFIQRLSSDSIGYRPLHLFTISAATTLTIVGALVTYTIVIFEVTGVDVTCPSSHESNITSVVNGSFPIY